MFDMVIAIFISVLEYLKSIGQLSNDKNIYFSLYAVQETNGVFYPQILGLFDSEDGGNTLLRNVGNYLPVNTP